MRIRLGLLGRVAIVIPLREWAATKQFGKSTHVSVVGYLYERQSEIKAEESTFLAWKPMCSILASI